MANASLEDVYLLRPLNEHPPTAEDKRHSKELEEFLRSSGLYESLDEALLREEVLGLFYQLVQSWVKGVCRKKNFNVEDARAHVYTFGSYRLGVHGPGSDMDTLVVGPRYVLRDSNFFGSEEHCLEYILSQTPDITDIQPVPDAFVPMIGIKYKGVQLDVLYAPLAMHTLPEQLDLSNHAVLRGCDEPTVRSLNGCRVTDTILRLVPRQDIFRLALRAVKHWASLRGIASNVTGYLGGVNLAIMVAKICQLYPRAEASTVLLKFFILLKAWPWPRAIHLRVPEDHSLGLPVWDPRPGTRDSLALMPVITPAYPSMNSLYNVQRSTLEVMTGEFAAAADVCTSFMRCRGGQPIDWTKLFTPVPFFTQHTFYIQLEVSADGEHDLVLWDGWVSSRIRRLVRNLEDHVRVRPYPKAQRPPPGPKSADPERPRLLYYIGIDKRLAAQVTAAQLLPNGQVAALPPHAAAGAPGAPAGKVDLKQPCMIFVNEVTAWPAKRPGMELRVNVLRKAQLPPWLTQPKTEQQQQAEGAAERRQVDGPSERQPTPQLEAPPPAADGAPSVAGADAEAGAAKANGPRSGTASPSGAGTAEAAPAAAVAGVKRPAPDEGATEEAAANAPASTNGPAAATGDLEQGQQQGRQPQRRRPSPPAKRQRAEQAMVLAATTAPQPGPQAPVRPSGTGSGSASPSASQDAQDLVAAAAATAAAAAATSPARGKGRSAKPPPLPSPATHGSLEPEAQQQLEAQASVADERAAEQETQLLNTGRDMGDWIGVDCGVSLAAQSSPGGSGGGGNGGSG